MMITAARRADRPTASFMFFRLLAVVFLAIDLVKGATMEEWAGYEFWLFVAIAEYAATIRTLPPVEARSAERSVGKEVVSTCRSRWSPEHYKKKEAVTRENSIANYMRT